MERLDKILLHHLLNTIQQKMFHKGMKRSEHVYMIVEMFVSHVKVGSSVCLISPIIGFIALANPAVPLQSTVDPSYSPCTS